jgi:hypothetical protein
MLASSGAHYCASMAIRVLPRKSRPPGPRKCGGISRASAPVGHFPRQIAFFSSPYTSAHLGADSTVGDGSYAHPELDAVGIAAHFTNALDSLIDTG